jgi:hypothetical protein
MMKNIQYQLPNLMLCFSTLLFGGRLSAEYLKSATLDEYINLLKNSTEIDGYLQDQFNLSIDRNQALSNLADEFTQKE